MKIYLLILILLIGCNSINTEESCDTEDVCKPPTINENVASSAKEDMINNSKLCNNTISKECEVIQPNL